MDTNDLNETLRVAMERLTEIGVPMLAAIDNLSDAMHGVYNLDGHSDESYRYMQGKLEAARLAIVEAHAHLSMVCTKAPTHAHYIGGTPTHLYRQRNPDYN